MAAYFVSTTGNDSGNGSSETPWRTISRAMQANLQPGDEVVVRPGTYAEAVTITRSGSAAGDVTLRSEIDGAALIRPPSGAWNAVSVYANHVTIKGFDIKGGKGDGIEANDVHHISVLDNTIHGAGESGIQFNWAEFIRIEGNHVYGNASSGWFSGISIYQTRNITGDTTTAGYRTIVKNNISHDNVTKTGLHTDGNGIIIDDFQSTQTSGNPNYNYPTLVENNLVYNNGGKGIAVHWSDNVTVRNNTSWHNNLDPLNTGTWRGELSNQDSRDNVWVNNIAVADPTVNSNNTAIGFYGSNARVVWESNLTFNGVIGAASLKLEGGSNPAPSAANGNLLGVDPRFVGAPANFDLAANSPARDAGTAKYGLAATDLDGGARAIGAVDMGAYESGDGAANRAPSATNDSGFQTAYGTPATIRASTLIANDSDPDGDALGVVAVSGATGGTVRLNSASDVVFTPAPDFSGAAGFDYKISDGRGGESSARVSLTVAPPPTVNAPPVAVNDAATTREGATVTIYPLGNDRDPDGDPLSLAVLDLAGTIGAVTTGSNGAVVYNPSGRFEHLGVGKTAIDKFGYTVADGKGGRAAGVVTVTVTGENDAPVAVADSGFRVAAGAAITIRAETLLANDRDIDGDVLKVVAVDRAVGGTVRLDASGSVVFTAAGSAGGPGSFRYVIDDGNGSQASAAVSLSIDPSAGPANDIFGFWTEAPAPAVISDPDTVGVELGMKFVADVDGFVTGLRFFKGPENIGTHTGALWTSGGKKLASLTFHDETASGWQEALFDKPVEIDAGKSYVASYFAPKGRYSSTEDYFMAAVDHGPLRTPADAGVYKYGSKSAFPNKSYESSNYWVDVVFDPDDVTIADNSLLGTAAPFSLALSTSANRSGARLLDGATVAGDAFIFVAGATDTNIDIVRFRLDGKAFRTEYHADFDFNGTGSSGLALAWSTEKVAEGAHTIAAELIDFEGATTVLTGAFSVDNF